MLHIIAAIGQNNELGKDNKLLWYSPSDLKNFKSITHGYPMIMGRKTFESLPGVLKHRPHLVVTKKEMTSDNPNVTFHKHIENAVNCAGDMSNDTFIIGGGNIYSQCISSADVLHITRVEWSGDADTYFPEFDESLFTVEEIKYSPENDKVKWTYKKYVRK